MRRSAMFQHVGQADVERPELPAVVAGGDLDDPRQGPRADALGRGPLDGLEGQAVEDNLINALALGREPRLDQAAEAGREGRVRARPQRLVLAADLRTRP